tara:strand:+ start:8913 stop:9020 length:108 start_codon:yes stop_codon:yes gene_type:complete
MKDEILILLIFIGTPMALMLGATLWLAYKDKDKLD